MYEIVVVLQESARCLLPVLTIDDKLHEAIRSHWTAVLTCSREGHE